jgi:hypothetical protein
MDDSHRVDATLKYKFEGLLIMVWIIGAQFNPYGYKKATYLSQVAFWSDNRLDKEGDAGFF